MGGPPSITRLAEEECLALLSGASVGRVAISVDALPAIHSVRFALTAEHIVFRVAPGSNLRRAAAGVVAFHADSFDPLAKEGWCVHVTGLCEEVTDRDVLAEMRSLPLEAWALGESADHFFRVPLSSLTGERVRWPNLGG